MIFVESYIPNKKVKKDQYSSSNTITQEEFGEWDNGWQTIRLPVAKMARGI
jgi:hypothetical protein